MDRFIRRKRHDQTWSGMWHSRNLKETKTTYRLICDTVLAGICYLAYIQERTFLGRHGQPPPERLPDRNSSRLLHYQINKTDKMTKTAQLVGDWCWKNTFNRFILFDRRCFLQGNAAGLCPQQAVNIWIVKQKQNQLVIQPKTKQLNERKQLGR